MHIPLWSIKGGFFLVCNTTKISFVNINNCFGFNAKEVNSLNSPIPLFLYYYKSITKPKKPRIDLTNFIVLYILSMQITACIYSICSLLVFETIISILIFKKLKGI